MTIKTLHKQALSDLINSDAFRNMPVIPISPHRGRSHVENPRAKDADILMVLVYEGEEMIGYLGLLPDDMFLEDNTYHCAWMSCIWVSEKSRGKGVARQMVEKAFEVWDGKILATEFTPHALAIYRKLNLFDDLQTARGLRIYTRLAMAKVFPEKMAWMHILKPFLWFGDVVGNVFMNSRWNKLYNNRDFENLTFSETANISIDNNISGFNRNQKEIEWMINNPWLLQQSKTDPMSRKYHFSTWAKQLKYLFVEENDSKNKMLLFIRDNHLKIPFVWGNWSFVEIEKVMIYCTKQFGVVRITTFHPEMVEAIRNVKKVFSRIQKREYLVGKEFLEQIIPVNDIYIQDGDGDCGFT